MAENLVEAISGASGALVSTAVLYPLDLVKTRLQSQLYRDGALKEQGEKAQQAKTNYDGIVDGFSKILKSEGAGGLYAGLSGYGLKASVDNFTYFYWRQMLFNLFEKISHRSLGVIGNLVLSSFAGLFHKMVNLPLDVVSTRQQTARDGSTMMENARAIQVRLDCRS